MIPWRLSTFVVQGFVMLSGVKLFLNGKDKLPFFKYIKPRIKGVILPYAICFAVYYVCFMYTSGYPLDYVFIVKHFLLGSLACHFYFIPLIFQFDLLFPVWKRLVNKCSPVIIIPFALLISQIFENCLPQVVNTFLPNINFIYNDRLFTTYLSFWLIGCYIGKNYDTFCEILKKNFSAVCVIESISLLLVVFFSYLAYNNIMAVLYLNYIHNLYIISTCIFLYAVSLRMPADFYDKIPWLRKIDKYSLYIYLYHMLVIFFVENLVK